MDNEIKRLIEVNNEHLRTKGKLLQEIVDLKKQIIQQDKNLALISEKQLIIEELQKSESRLKRNLSLMELQKEKAMAEIERMKNIKWYNRLLGKK